MLHLLGQQFSTALRFPPVQPTLVLTGLGFCPLYREAAAAPFSQPHCKHRNNWEKPGVLERRRRARASKDCISSCLGSVCWALPLPEALQMLPRVAGQVLRCPSVPYLACVGQGIPHCSFIEMVASSLFLVLALCVSAAVEESPAQ